MPSEQFEHGRYERGSHMQAIVDRIEGDIAVLEINGSRYLNAPLSELPEGTRQGDVLEGQPGSWRRDDAERARRELFNKDLMKRLFKK